MGVIETGRGETGSSGSGDRRTATVRVVPEAPAERIVAADARGGLCDFNGHTNGGRLAAALNADYQRGPR